jgi:hypothetical protein
MKQRFILFRRAGVFDCEDTDTRKQISLKTRDEDFLAVLKGGQMTAPDRFRASHAYEQSIGQCCRKAPKFNRW